MLHDFCPQSTLTRNFSANKAKRPAPVAYPIQTIQLYVASIIFIALVLAWQSGASYMPTLAHEGGTPVTGSAQADNLDTAERVGNDCVLCN